MLRVLLSLIGGVLAAQASASPDDALWARVQAEPRMVIALRHAEVGAGDPLAFDESGNCLGEMRLTNKGRAQAAAIGKLFGDKGVQPQVIASPMCRCRNTAEIAFGAQRISHLALREVASADRAGFQEFLSVASGLLKQHAGTRPIVFISHMPNIDALSGEQIGFGVGLVGRVTADGDIEPLGRIKLY